ncbi:MAG: hypothetical protein GF401_00040 [Chitinivibrionales bacterium]|nr:hypothetical protein [Chitinivibrionales bacterium]
MADIIDAVLFDKNQLKKGAFALVGYPPDFGMFRSYIRQLRPDKDYKDTFLLKLFQWAPSYKLQEWNNITVDNAFYADGTMIMVPFLPEMKDIPLKRMYEKIEHAVALASENGCTVVSLGAFTSLILRGFEQDLAEKYNVTITSGTYCTIALIIRSIELVAERFGIDLETSALAIIGPSGDIGAGCASYFGDKAGKLILCGQNENKIHAMVDTYKEFITRPVEICGTGHKLPADARITLFITSSYTSLFMLSDFPSTTIVVDVAGLPRDREQSPVKSDSFIYRGGIARTSFELDLGFDIGLPSAYAMYGCQAEGILLACDPSLPASWAWNGISLHTINRYLEKLADSPLIGPGYAFGDRVLTDEELTGYAQECFALRI